MRSRTVPLVALAMLGFTAPPVAAQGFRTVEPYRSFHARHGGGYGYADEFVRGSYVGAPFTRVPSPSDIVPAPWSYGTYGIPTVSGIAAAPVGQPTLTVINGRGSRARSEDGGAARVIEIAVPRR